MTATSDAFKDIVPSPAQNWNQMVPARSVAIAADGQSGIIWNHWKVTTQSRHAIHIRPQCPEDSILKANLVKLVNARYKQRL